MSHKVTLIMNGPDKYSWSESFYYNGPVDTTTLDTNVAALITGRAAILTSNCTIIRARCATTFYRNPHIIIPNNGAGAPGNEMPPTAEQEVALLYLIQGNPNGYSRPFLKGIPSRIINGDSYAPDAAWNANLTTFVNTLLNGLWNVVGVNSTMTPLQYPMAVLSGTPPRGYTFTYTVPVGGASLVVGQIIRVAGTNVPGYAGLKRVVKIGGAGGLVTVGGAAPPVDDEATSPYFTTQSALDNPIQSAQPDSITTRKSGRPFGLTRGRRATLYSLRR
jgi:hypothetical protein